MDIRAYNRKAWDKNVANGNDWTRPVASEVTAAARRGEWRIVLTATRPVPLDWFPPLAGRDVLCLASGGGQQGPVLAAAGARVTVLDNSPRQLEQDRFVAERDGLNITTIEGDMADLFMLADESFDLIVNPVSNVFIPSVLPVWVESYRVLRHGGALLTGFMNPDTYIFDRELLDDQDILQIKYRLPYSDLDSLDEVELKRQMADGWALEWSHSLEEQIGGQLSVGFMLTSFYEDRDPRTILFDTMPVYYATRAIKP